ncbi:hypothetical protein ABNI15_08670 [Limosilactobacillus fermentum]|uniref:hypothetical protein n=1 Tax=Limosilactobacillus fermentum TaxID=1613 RepID=UPI0038CFD5C5
MTAYSTKQLLEWYLQGDHEVAISHGLTLNMLESYLQEHGYERDLKYKMIKTLERELKAMDKD